MRLSFWPHGIILGLLSFCSFIIFIIVLFSRQQVGLVVEDYYREEMAYQQRMQEMANAAALGNRLTVDFLRDEHQFVLTYPQAAENRPLEGTITFFRPSDETMDFTVPVAPMADLRQVVAADGLPEGLWRVKVKWNSGEDHYYAEEKLILR